MRKYFWSWGLTDNPPNDDVVDDDDNDDNVDDDNNDDDKDNDVDNDDEEEDDVNIYLERIMMERKLPPRPASATPKQ